ncbi:hypothetical protein D3C87_1367320 [compost metagenome]
MVHLAFKYVAVVVSSLLIIAVAQAEDRANKRATRDNKLAVEKMQDRMNKNFHRGKYDPKKVQKSALKK